MDAFVFHHPTKIIFGRGSIAKLGEEAAKLGRNCLLVSGRNFAKRSGYLGTVEGNLSASGLRVVAFSEVEPNPSIETLYSGAAASKRDGCDVLVAFGGGSAIDAAKGIAFLASGDAKLEESFAPKEVLRPVIPIVAVPTTCGTGSEVTRYSVITDLATRRKRTLVGLPLLPKLALLDPAVLDDLPKRMIAYTGFDALSHSFEALLSKTSHRISDMLAIESITAICKNLVDALESLESRERVFYGSMLAGMAINTTGTVLVHGMGYYLTNYHDVHHGLANSVLLPYVLRFEGNCIEEKLLRVAANLGLRDTSSLLAMVEGIADQVGIPRGLSDLGIKGSELEAMVADALSYSRNLDNNPIKVSDKEVRDIYSRALSGNR
jgi:alcohol dehydrogenase class IV